MITIGPAVPPEPPPPNRVNADLDQPRTAGMDNHHLGGCRTSAADHTATNHELGILAGIDVQPWPRPHQARTTNSASYATVRRRGADHQVTA